MKEKMANLRGVIFEQSCEAQSPCDPSLYTIHKPK